MTITYLMYCSWMFTFQHIYEATFAAKNKRLPKFVLFENILDFWVMLMGMIYITVVYKVYRYDTFLARPPKDLEAELFFTNWARATSKFDDQIFLLIIDFTYLTKAVVQLRLLPVFGPVYVILKMLLRELLIFGIFFFLQQFLFAVIGNLLYHEVPSYSTLGASMLTIFKASAGVFNNADLVTAREGDKAQDYVFILTYMILCFILIVNLIVGQLSSAYARYAK